MASTSLPSVSSATERLRPDASTFGARLALLRQAKGWNIAEAAEACAVPAASWRNWELHDRTPRDQVTVCRRIADAASVELAWLAGMDTEAEAS